MASIISVLAILEACDLIFKRLIFDIIFIRIFQRLYHIRNILWMCYRIHIKRADENLKVKNQVLIRTEFSKLSQLFSWIPRCSKLVKARKRAKRGYCIQGLYILRIILLLMLFLDILYVKDNGWLFSPLFSYFINIYNYKTYI